MEIYAEISQKIMREIEDFGKDFILPEGVKWSRRWGSRACYLECDDDTKETLIDFLNNHSVTWQINAKEKEKGSFREFKGFSEFKEFKDSSMKKEKKGGFREINDSWSKNENY